ncbi:MAG: hypothetical protein ACM3ML_17270 [Micromonosporaceae bacterium]
MSVQEAAVIVQDARARARRELVISTPLVYTAWGLVWLIGYGAMWLSVRGQHPYTGPSGVSIAAVFVLAGFAVATVLVFASKASAGIDGRSARYRRIILATWVIGYLILLLVQAAISGSVSTRTLAFVGFAGPVLLAGLTYILASALGRNRAAFGLGAWLVIVGASCAWLAPAAILATCALAGGGAFLLAAVIETRLRAHDI